MANEMPDNSNHLPDWLSVQNYYDAKKWFLEADICFERAWILIFCNNILEKNDRHGEMEALQHTSELRIKSLYVLVGLNWVYSHNPAVLIDNFTARYFELFPELKDNPVMNQVIKWVKEHGETVKTYHESTFYGKEEEGKLPSESFTIDEVSIELKKVTQEIEFFKGVFRNIGKLLNVLTPEEEKILQETGKISKRIREDSTVKKTVADFVLEGFKTKK